MANASAGQSRRARAHGVALEDDHTPDAEPRQVVRGAHAHDAGADDHDLCGVRHPAPFYLAPVPRVAGAVAPRVTGQPSERLTPPIGGAVIASVSEGRARDLAGGEPWQSKATRRDSIGGHFS